MRASSILPQSGYMVFADEILEIGDGYASCAFSVKEDSPFTENGELGSYAYMEIMAQCIGAYSGYRNDGEARLGFLLGVRNLDISRAGQGGRARNHDGEAERKRRRGAIYLRLRDQLRRRTYCKRYA